MWKLQPVALLSTRTNHITLEKIVIYHSFVERRANHVCFREQYKAKRPLCKLIWLRRGNKSKIWRPGLSRKTRIS